MKKVIFFLSVLLLMPIGMRADDVVEMDGITYNVNKQASRAEVMKCELRSEVDIPAAIEVGGVTCKVEAIMKGAFSKSGVTSVTIPDNVTTIGGNAFSGCEKLESVTLPNGLTELGWYAFYGCKSLTSISIPGSLRKIDNSTFYGCSKLASLTIGNGVETIEKSVFSDCESLKAVAIPGSVREINTGAFFGCTGLESVTFEEGVTSIGGSVFSRCTSLTSVRLPNSLQKLGYAFSYCTSLREVVIPKLVRMVGGGTFEYCPALTDVYCLSVMVTRCIRSTFEYTDISQATLHVPAIVKDYYSIDEGWEGFGNIVAIGPGDPYYVAPTGKRIEFKDFGTELLCQYYYDQNCDFQLSEEEAAAVSDIGYNFTSTDIREFDEFQYFTGIGTLKRWSFQNCVALLHITLPNGLTTIENEALSSMDMLRYVVLPPSLKKVDIQAFLFCYSLKDVYCYAEDVPQCGFEAFILDRKMTLHVPASAIEKYKAAEVWGQFSSIVPLEEGDPGYAPTTAVTAVRGSRPTADVYTLTGSKVRSAVTGLEGLPRGVYVKGGRKVLVK